MSIEAMNWVLNHAPIPTDRRDASSLAVVLLGLANHADTEGRNAFPSVATLVRYSRLSERTVRRCLDALEELGLIEPSDPEIVAAYIRRADRRPQGWDLRVDGGCSQASSGVPSRHPAGRNGVPTRPHGVPRRPQRGVTTTPEPSKNRPENHRRARPRSVAADPPCGQCDARPGDPIAARLVLLDPGGTQFRHCPRCHPASLTQETRA